MPAWHGTTYGLIPAQASTDPEYQALLAKQGISAGTGDGAEAAAAAAAAASGLLSQQQKEAGLASVFKRDDEREKDPAFVSEAYAECYPEYHGYNATIVDSDEEADYTHMDSKFGKGRTDFQTEEEWQARTLLPRHMHRHPSLALIQPFLERREGKKVVASLMRLWGNGGARAQG